MHKNYYYLIIIILISIILISYNQKSIKSPNYLEENKPILNQISKENTSKIIKIIEDINKKNEKIQNLTSKINIHLNQKISINVFGNLYFEKEKNFRMNIFSNFGKELDIGSNENLFWFWSKNSDLYYSEHKNLNQTRLKTPLNPNWLLESLTIMELKKENIEYGKFKNFFIILQKRKGIQNEIVTIATLINPETKRIIGNYLYNQSGKMVASAEINEFYEDIPKKIFITWYEEGITMEWILYDYKINIPINKNIWELPKINSPINIGNPKAYKYRL